MRKMSGPLLSRTIPKVIADAHISLAASEECVFSTLHSV